LLARGITEFAPQTKTQVVPNIIEHRNFQATEKRPSTSICVVADIVFSVKQQDKILEVFSDLPKMQFELHFYGGGPDEWALAQMIKGRSNVFFHGRKSNAEILEILPQHDALLLFSAYETFGITVFEARQAGLWTISKKDFGGSSHYDDGCLVVDSYDDLSSAIHSIASLAPATQGTFTNLTPNRVGEKLSILYSKLLFTQE
jgi:glycosyltransferase involved in cell wall biosynthesis